MPGSLDDPHPSEPVFVIDSWPVLEWMKFREPTLSRFRGLMASASKGKCSLIMSTINQGEVYYNSAAVWGETRAERFLKDCLRLPIQVLHPTDHDVISAARIKAEYHVAYADCFAAVLAVKFKAALLTGDPDFLKLERGGVLTVDWWGR